ncbi:ABC transporter permease subunit [Ancylobacter lacus]|uniref:ABC transporter permease subunit n=1 Tax=Ancylobacter lacus TaxID=2579970 RepID=UPI001BCD7727|nr:ABC transporter permease subunit [Ancylobacter lacus]MBS7538472.1 ABC transporter permease subunit [Ancylobacter lacus]
MDFELLNEAIPLLMKGAQLTVLISVVGVLVGLPAGIALALLRASANRRLRSLVRLADGYAALFRGTPMLVQVFVLYYGLPRHQLHRSRAREARRNAPAHS